MCGRFTHHYTWQELYTLLRLTSGTPLVPAEIAPRFNVAPTQHTPVVTESLDGQRSAGNEHNAHGQRAAGAERTARTMRWGLVPSWASDPVIGSRLINARSEEASTKPSFRAACKQRRCLVPISEFYEWETVPHQRTKQPWAFRVTTAPLCALAGLWEHWHKPDTGLPALETFTILTCAPNALLGRFHDRMPCIVPPQQYDAWLDPNQHDWSALKHILQPFPAEQMEATRVSTRVNSPRNDDPTLIQPVEGGTLF